MFSPLCLLKNKSLMTAALLYSNLGNFEGCTSLKKGLGFEKGQGFGKILAQRKGIRVENLLRKENSVRKWLNWSHSNSLLHKSESISRMFSIYWNISTTSRVFSKLTFNSLVITTRNIYTFAGFIMRQNLIWPTREILHEN